MNRYFQLIFWTSIIVSFLTAIWFALNGTMHFHTDIARDFLLVEDVVVRMKPTLIGPHSGGIEGVFHGPLWIYVNIPAFLLSKGDPGGVAWFWAVLTLGSIGIVYWVTKKLSDTQTAMIAAALFGLVISESSSNLFNPSGAVFLAPLFFYFLIRYLKNSLFLHLFISLFLIGLIIQFQMAWGVPILILMIPLLIHHFFIHKKFSHFFSFVVLALPLSTFILFDVRHQFLQINSVIAYLTHPKIQNDVSLFNFLRGRVFEIGLGNIALSFILTFFACKKIKNSFIVFLFLYLYFGYFIITLLFRGTLWGYYTIPFIPLFCISIAITSTNIPKKWITLLFALLISPFLLLNIQNLILHNKSYFKRGNGLWTFYKNQAQTIYKEAESEFGWYVYSADQYGYSAKYAMHYAQRNSTKKGFSFEKKKITYLIITPSINIYTSETDWKKNKIKITRKPDKIITFSDGSYAEKYILSPEELAVPAASDLIKDLLFR